ncbi:MAG: hypothetical protein ACI93R_001349 [Flavobacteriales bacterium]|jgi:hypothetical protein
MRGEYESRIITKFFRLVRRNKRSVDCGVVWFVVFTLAHDFVYKTHIIVYKISRASFDTIHYAGMGLYKLAIIVFNLVPYLVLELL